jgi:hypothetical protein
MSSESELTFGAWLRRRRCALERLADCGEQAFGAACSEGEALSLDGAVADAMAIAL